MNHLDEKTTCDWRWSLHAQARLQQRGIPRDAADILLEWGTQAHTGINGRETLFFRKSDLQRLARDLPKAQWLSLEKRRHLFAVMGSDGAVVTVGFRVRHMSRH